MPTTSASWIAATAVAAALLANAASTQPPQGPTTAAGEAAARRDGSSGSAPGDVAFVDSLFPTVTARDDGTIRASVLVRNPRDSEVVVSPRFVLRSASGGWVESTVKPPHTVTLKSKIAYPLNIEMQLPKLRLAAFPLTGWLILEEPPTTSGAAMLAKIEIKGILGPRTETDWDLLWKALIMAFIAVMLAAGVAIRRVGKELRSKPMETLLHRMGGPTWNFTSWSSNVAIAGTVFANFNSFTVLSDQGDSMSKKTYMIVSLLLAAIVGLAPGVYSLFNRTVQTKDDSGASVPQTQGYVVLFLAAALCTLTGALAQLQLLKLLMHDIAVAGSMSLAMAEFWQGLLLVLQALLWANAIGSIIQTIQMQSAPKTDAPKLVAEGMKLPPANKASQPLPRWSLL